jgi:DNA-binding NtrC family response regulator
MRRLFRLVERVAASDSTVLVTGETGTGKGLVARAIHQRSRRSAGAFVALNCGAIPENLLESELFGHVRGAFTGATANKAGKFEAAHGGTLFLDEIGDMRPDLQVKLLRALEEGEFEPVGGCQTIRVDVRIIAATHRDLEARVAEGRFREDLFYRLYVIPLPLPPLRERPEDIPLLLDHFRVLFRNAGPTVLAGFTPSALDVLCAYPWPGNVREIRNLVERLTVLQAKAWIGPEDLPERVTAGAGTAVHAAPRVAIADQGICLNEAVTEFEKALILKSLEKTKWVKNQATKLLRLNRTTLVEKIKRHGIDTPPEAEDHRAASAG